MFVNLAPAEVATLVKEAERKKLEKVLEDGSELTLDFRKSGDFLGENIFSDDGTYPVNAICLEDTLTCGFSKTYFEQLVLQNPNIGLQVIENLSKRIPSLTSHIESLAVANIARACDTWQKISLQFFGKNYQLNQPYLTMELFFYLFVNLRSRSNSR